jgi:hypothetical protein
MWISHFFQGTDEDIVAECAGFFDDLFHNKIVVYVARRGGRALGFGWFYRDAAARDKAEQGFYRLSRQADDLRAGTWSAPWVEDGIDEDAEAALADLARDEITRLFGDQRPEIGDGFRVARFTCRSPSLGDVVVEAAGVGVLVEVGTYSLGFNEGTPAEIVGELARFLDGLFHDKVVVWSAFKDGRLLGFGHFRPDDTVSPYFRRLSLEADDLRAETWSGPWEDDGIVAHG